MAQSLRHEIAHLLRRAGFGSSTAELDAYTALGFEGAVDHLIKYEQVDDSALETTIQQMRSSNPESTNANHPEWGNPALEVATWYTRMLLTERPLQEKMTFFWHGLLTSSIYDVHNAHYMQRQNDLYRSNALAPDFKELIRSLARDPAMLLYLDNYTNRKGKPNENWARELMELFTLGIGNYTEQDVKESARAFTGWSLNKSGDFVFLPNQHDEGQKTFLGVTGNLNGDDIIDIIFSQPAHGKYIARRLIRFFVYDNPDDSMVSRYADVYVKSGFNIKETMRQILLSPEFRSDQAFYALIKSPVEFTIGALRFFSAYLTDVKLWTALSGAMASMGQQIFAPPNVGGWPGGRDWVNSTAYYNRANLARQIVSAEGNMSIDPVEMAAQANVTNAQQAVDYFLEVMLQADIDPDYRSALVTFMNSTGGGAQGFSARLRGLARLIMSSPAYQMN